MAINKPTFGGKSVGVHPLFKMGSSLGDFSTELLNRSDKNKQQAIENARQQELMDIRNAQEARIVEEANRKALLRDTTQDVAKDFAQNPYASRFGTGAATADADRSVVQSYGDDGTMGQLMSKYSAIEDPAEAESFYMKNIDPKNRAMQGVYEQVVPYQEDAAKGIAAQLIAKGEDPTKALATGSALSTGLLSKADHQKKMDASLETLRDQEKARVKGNLEAEKLNQKYYNKAFGSSGKKSGGKITYADILKSDGEVDKLGISPSVIGLNVPWPDDVSEVKKFFVQAQSQNYPAAVALKAVENAYEPGLDNKINIERAAKLLAEYGKGGVGSGKNGAFTSADFTPKVIPDQVVGYDSEKWNDKLLASIGGNQTTAPGSKGILPQTDKPTKGKSLTERFNNPGALKLADPNNAEAKWKGEVGRDKYGHIQFDTPANGARAQAINAYNTITKNKPTVQEYINKYATGNQKQYADFVAKQLGITPNTTLKPSDVRKLIETQAKFEGSTGFSSKVFDDGYAAAVKDGKIPSSASSDMKPKLDDLGALLNTSTKNPGVDWSGIVDDANKMSVGDPDTTQFLGEVLAKAADKQATQSPDVAVMEELEIDPEGMEPMEVARAIHAYRQETGGVLSPKMLNALNHYANESEDLGKKVQKALLGFTGAGTAAGQGAFEAMDWVQDKMVNATGGSILDTQGNWSEKTAEWFGKHKNRLAKEYSKRSGVPVDQVETAFTLVGALAGGVKPSKDLIKVGAKLLGSKGAKKVAKKSILKKSKPAPKKANSADKPAASKLSDSEIGTQLKALNNAIKRSENVSKRFKLKKTPNIGKKSEQNKLLKDLTTRRDELVTELVRRDNL